MKQKKVFIVVPAYNEAKHIHQVIEKIKKNYKNIIVVDDGSSDKTFEIAQKSGVLGLKHIINLGKGAALKTGCDYSVRNGADIIVVMDSDGQHLPEDIPKFLKALKGKDIVFGSRELNKKMPFVLKFGNWFIQKVNNLLTGVKVRDTQSGFRAFTSKAYRKIRWESTQYSVESEMIMNVGKRKLKYAEIEIKTIYQDDYKGTTVLDGVKIVLLMFWWKITRW